MAAVHFDGYYCSNAIDWENWHAGVRMHGTHFHYRRFFANRNWLGSYRDTPCEFWTDSERFDAATIEDIKRGRGPTDKEANPLWIAGTYEIQDGKIIQSLAPDFAGGYVWVTSFAIFDDRIVGPTREEKQMTLLFRPARIDGPINSMSEQ